MHATHSLLQCPLHNLATMTIDTRTRTITYASADMIQLLDNEDPTGTQWPSKQDQQLCFTTLVDVHSSQRQKRLLTCEHINTQDPATTIIQCADISALEQFYYNNQQQQQQPYSFFTTFVPTSSTHTTTSTILLRMNPYGVIQAAFAPIQSPSLQTSLMIGQPLMRFIHNDDIPILCSGLRQVTRCQQDNDDDDDDDDNDHDDDDDTELTMMTFDLRCDLHCLFGDNNNNNNNNDDDDPSPFYHFTTVVTSTQDILCIMRPSSDYDEKTTAFQQQRSFSPLSSTPSSSTCSSRSSSSSFCSPPTSTTTATTATCHKRSSSSASSSFSSSAARTPRQHPTNATTTTAPSFLYQLVHLFRHSGTKLKHLVHGLHQALWHAAEQGLMLLAHYLAVVMVLALQYYRLARHPSFWLETSELALRCLVAETKTRPELDRLFSWLEWSGLPSSRRLFGMALDHGSEWFISVSLRS